MIKICEVSLISVNKFLDGGRKIGAHEKPEGNNSYIFTLEL